MNAKKKKTVELAALGLLLAIAAIMFFFRGSSAGSVKASTLLTAYKPLGVTNPKIHWNRLEEVQSSEYKSSGRNIFARVVPPPPPPPPVIEPVGPVAPPPPPPPPPPQLPLKFLGSGAGAHGANSEAFLSDGDTVYVVAQGETVLGHFKITHISSVSIEFEELRTGRSATVPVEDKGPSM